MGAVLKLKNQTPTTVAANCSHALFSTTNFIIITIFAQKHPSSHMRSLFVLHHRRQTLSLLWTVLWHRLQPRELGRGPAGTQTPRHTTLPGHLTMPQAPCLFRQTIMGPFAHWPDRPLPLHQGPLGCTKYRGGGCGRLTPSHTALCLC